jgi:excinuclease UvrABC nuclease subunit
MEKSAKELDFMQAAKLRDEIKHVRTIDLIILLLKTFNKLLRQ